MNNIKRMCMDSGERTLLVSEEGRFEDIRDIFHLPVDKPIIIGGPCAVEGMEAFEEIAAFLREKKVKCICGRTYKPGTSFYDFQELEEDGLKILKEVATKYSLITVAEVANMKHIDLVSRYADIMQIGARSMQNYELLKEVGATGRPVILKRGSGATLEEFILAAEYLACKGNRSIVLCEGGIRTFETKTRNTLDISSIPIIKKETCLPIIVDLSHSLGRKDIINPVAKSVLAAGADGIVIEVHHKPETALSDSKQQLDENEFTQLMSFLEK